MTYTDREILSKTPVFVGTRVPLADLIDYLKHGYRLNKFLHNFASVSREQVVAALVLAHEALISGARAA